MATYYAKCYYTVHDDRTGQDVSSSAAKVYANFSGSSSTLTEVSSTRPSLGSSAGSSVKMVFSTKLYGSGASTISSEYSFVQFEVKVRDKRDSKDLASKTFSNDPTYQDSWTGEVWNVTSIFDSNSSTGSSSALCVEVILHVRSTPPNVTVSYNANGGSPTPASQTVTLGSSVTLAGAITKSGYTFGGWSIGGTTYAAGATYKPTGNVTATAIWNALATYTVIFSDGGLNVATITAKYGETIGSGGKYAWPTVSPPSGYTLSGWQIGGTIYTPSQRYTVTGNVTATAIISGSSATLYALTNSAAVAGSDYTWNCTLVIKQSGVTATLPDGYDLIPSSSAVKVSKAGIKFYTGTNYSPVNYKVISGLNLDISTSFKGQTVSVTGRRSVGGMIYTSSGGYASDDTLFVINAPEGYRAYGWIWGKGYNYQNASTGFLLGDTFPLRLWGVISQEHQYHALVPVLIKVHKVTFDPNGGTGGPSPVEAVHGENWACPLTFPTRTGYTCKGWSTSKTATSPEFVAGRTYGPLTADLTIYAVWVPNRGILAFNANGGTVSPEYKAVNVGDAYGTLPTPSRSGCTFIGWFTATSGGTQVNTTTKMSTSGVDIIYAHWKTGSVSTSVTVTLNADGGTVSPSVVTATGNYPTLPNPTKTGHTFAGWFSTLYGDIQVRSGDALLEDENHTIFAHWNRGNVTVTFDANGGTVSQTSKTVAYGLRLGKLPEPVLDGKTFAGWFTDRTGGKEVTSATTVTSAITLYARWDESAPVDWWAIETF